MSGTLQQVMYELGIKQYRLLAYHAESQGALENFHQTLKSMIKSCYFDTENDWDEGKHLLLFAVRESVLESHDFSLFELVLVRLFVGPVKLLREISHKETLLWTYFSTYLKSFERCKVKK